MQATTEWRVQVSKRPSEKSGYVDKYTFASEYQARFYYNSINIGRGYKKRLVNPQGKVVARQFS